MVLAKPAGTNPRALAAALVAELEKPIATSAEIAGPGFINLRLTDGAWLDELRLIAAAGAGYGRSTLGGGKVVNVEYVSANPTGPMHMGHCRGAVVGDALASLLESPGTRSSRILRQRCGRAGRGPRPLGAFRYREALGEAVGEIPKGSIRATIWCRWARRWPRNSATLCRRARSEWLALFRQKAVAAMMVMIKDLALLGINHDLFSSEAELQAAGKPEAAEAWLRAHDLVYDGHLEAPKGKTPEDWEPVELPLFRSTKFGDDQDRPIKKSDGSWTYFGADLAYFQKAQKADALVDIWGADHAGTVKRIKAAVAALTGAEGKPIPFEVKLVQMVQLLRDGEPVKMSKRAGTFVTLADVVRSGQGRGPLHHADPQARCADGLRLRQGGGSVEGQSGVLCAICHARISSTLRKGAARACALRCRSCGAGAGGAGAGEAGRAVPASGGSGRDRARAAPGRVLPLRSGGSVPLLLEPGQRSTRKTVHSGTGCRVDGGSAFPRGANRAGCAQRPCHPWGGSGRGTVKGQRREHGGRGAGRAARTARRG
jgi:arginyl-tRNA synthetase